MAALYGGVPAIVLGYLIYQNYMNNDPEGRVKNVKVRNGFSLFSFINPLLDMYSVACAVGSKLLLR